LLKPPLISGRLIEAGILRFRPQIHVHSLLVFLRQVEGDDLQPIQLTAI
jgi:hypothetical protein